MQLQAQGPEPRGDGGQQLVFADEGHSGATLVRPGAWRRCATWPPRAAWTCR
jgi:hypothetical protein